MPPARTGLWEQALTALRNEILNFAASRLRVCAMVTERLPADQARGTIRAWQARPTISLALHACRVVALRAWHLSKPLA